MYKGIELEVGGRVLVSRLVFRPRRGLARRPDGSMQLETREARLAPRQGLPSGAFRVGDKRVDGGWKVRRGDSLRMSCFSVEGAFVASDRGHLLLVEDERVEDDLIQLILDRERTALERGYTGGFDLLDLRVERAAVTAPAR